MKKLFGYIIGLATILAVFAMIYMVGAIYDTGGRATIEPYFFRTGLSAANQTGMPRSISEVGERKIRDWLIQKFVTEYFYVIPDVENVAQRTGGGSVIWYMSAPNVMREWEREHVPKIQELAESGARRTVRVFNEIFKPENSDYWHVDYELKTWYKPNDMSETPTTTRGTMHIKLQDTDKMGRLYDDMDAVQSALMKGVDPAVVFVFRVSDVMFEKE